MNSTAALRWWHSAAFMAISSCSLVSCIFHQDNPMSRLGWGERDERAFAFGVLCENQQVSPPGGRGLEKAVAHGGIPPRPLVCATQRGRGSGVLETYHTDGHISL